MRDDPVDLLERELLGAARRMGAAVPAAAPVPARRRAGWSAVGQAGSVIVVFLVAAVALVGLHGHTVTQATPGIRPADQGTQLRSVLGVLRRPQTAADRRALRRSHLLDPARLMPGERVDRASARLATITPWHAHVLMMLDQPTMVRVADPLRGLLLFTGEGAGCCATGADVAGTGDVNYETLSGPPAVTRVYAVVPDGVARVAFHAAMMRGGRRRTISATVHGNVAAAQTPGPCCAGWSPFMTWYAADGRVIKVVRDVSGSGSVTARRALIGALVIRPVVPTFGSATFTVRG